MAWTAFRNLYSVCPADTFSAVYTAQFLWCRYTPFSPDQMKLIISFCFLNLTIQLSAQTKVVEFEGGYLTVMVANKWESTESKRTLSLTQKIVNENLQITYAFADGSTLDDFYKTYVSESFPEEFEGFKIIEEKSQTINGRKFKSL